MDRKRVEPGPGQESVWDYPRPPRIEDTSRRIRVIFNHVCVAQSTRAKRVLETSHPPVYYFPPQDVAHEYLRQTERTSFCEWKGQANYFAVYVYERSEDNAAWCYRQPSPVFEAIKDHIAFYPSKMDACYVEDEMVSAQPGDFYGGWITKDIVGPFKGQPGTGFW
jgi:uncharacterized protein (DUF427 family)